MNVARRLVAEGLGTAFLLAAVVGSGIMAERLAAGNVALALLANAVATGAALVALILAFGSISGAHFNPAVTLSAAFLGGLPWRDVPGYIAAQMMGACVGVATAHVMFSDPGVFHLAARAGRKRPALQRVRRDLRIADRHLGVCPHAAVRRALCGRRLHRGGLLVHVLHLVR